MTNCRYCAREMNQPCMSTRDMEDNSIEGGHDACLYQLALKGGGEKGLRYVILNRLARFKPETDDGSS